MNIAREVSRRSTCLRRRFGAVIVQRDQIIATGYCGAPRETLNCIDLGLCARKELNIKAGENYELCRGVHAEQNAIIHASRLDMLGASLYLVGVDAESDEVLSYSEPCKICKRMIINSGIERVVILKQGDIVETIRVQDWIECNINELENVDGRWRPVIKPGY